MTQMVYIVGQLSDRFNSSIVRSKITLEELELYWASMDDDVMEELSDEDFQLYRLILPENESADDLLGDLKVNGGTCFFNEEEQVAFGLTRESAMLQFLDILNNCESFKDEW